MSSEHNSMRPRQRVKLLVIAKWYWLPAWILVLLLVLVVGLLAVSSLPPGADFNYPLRWALIRVVRVLIAPISAGLVLSVLVIPAFVIWVIRQRFFRRTRPDQPPLLSGPFFALFIAALLRFALAVIAGPYVDIERIDSTSASSHRYYLDANITRSDGSQYFLFICDPDGTSCHLFEDYDTSSLPWRGSIRLVLDGEDLHLMIDGNIYQTYYGAGR